MIAAAGRTFPGIARKSAFPLTARLPPPMVLGCAYMLVAAAVRLVMLGLPAVQVDEQFYLLVGQRMAAGAVPYVDLWDRKPYGLFLIYRAVFAVPFDPVLTYQMMGIAFSTATAMVIARTARLIAPERGSVLAGLVYLLFQPTFNAALGQSPVFYNLPMALGALTVINARLQPRDEMLVRRGITAMLLAGLAIQIKYTAAFEGIGLGLLLLARARDDGRTLPWITGTGLLWAAAALAPTAAVAAGYVLAGHWETFVQANFLSIFGRRTDWPDAAAQLSKEALAMTPFAFAILVAPVRLRLSGGSQPFALRYVRYWAGFATVGFLLLPPWYDHYLGPLLVPLSILSAPALGSVAKGGRWYGRLLLGFGTIGAIVAPGYQAHERGTAEQFAQATRLVSANLKGRCLYVFHGDTALYRTTNACIPTRFAFPSHLDAMNEAGSLGLAPVAEVRRIMSSHPGVVVMADSKRANLANLATLAIVQQRLKHDYERYAEVMLGTRRFGLYRLKR